jgi:hypothetical protein
MFLSLLPVYKMAMRRSDLALNSGFDCNVVGPKIDLNKSR